MFNFLCIIIMKFRIPKYASTAYASSVKVHIIKVHYMLKRNQMSVINMYFLKLLSKIKILIILIVDIKFGKKCSIIIGHSIYLAILY